MTQATFTNVDRDNDGKMDHFLVEFTYEGMSGSGTVGEVAISLDGEDISPDKVRMKAGEGDFQSVRPGMFISGSYGDKVVIEVAREGGLSKGSHSLKFITSVEGYPVSFVLEGTV